MALEIGRICLLTAALLAGLEANFAATAWGKKMEKMKAKAAMNDFDRYKAMVAKAKRGRLVRKAFNQLKKSA